MALEHIADRLSTPEIKEVLGMSERADLLKDIHDILGWEEFDCFEDAMDMIKERK